MTDEAAGAPRHRYAVRIEREVEYEATSAEEARKQAIADLNDNLEDPGTNDDVADLTAGQALPPTRVYAVQFMHGGIPEDPELYDKHESALRRFVELAVEAGLAYTEDCSEGWIGDGDDEVRLYGPIAVAATGPAPVTHEWVKDHFEARPFSDAQRAEVDRIVGTIRAEERRDREAREVQAEDSTPERPGGCD
jgi:hypothetical protein